MKQFNQLPHFAAALACATLVAACGGGGGGDESATTTPASIVNKLVCSNPGAQVSTPANAIIIFFSTVYSLEVGSIDPLGAFIQTSNAIFELAADNTATLDGATVPISSACYQASTNTLTVAFGRPNATSAGSLELSSGGKAVGTINGKAVRTTPR
jgi:hypothetical protein